MVCGYCTKKEVYQRSSGIERSFFPSGCHSVAFPDSLNIFSHSLKEASSKKPQKILEMYKVTRENYNILYMDSIFDL